MPHTFEEFKRDNTLGLALTKKFTQINPAPATKADDEDLHEPVKDYEDEDNENTFHEDVKEYESEDFRYIKGSI